MDIPDKIAKSGTLIAGILMIMLGIYMARNVVHPEETWVPVFKKMNNKTAKLSSATAIVLGIVVVVIGIRTLLK